MYSNLRVLALMVIVILAFSRAAWPSEDQPHPIWWSPSMDLESLDLIDERLERTFSTNPADGIPVIKGEEPGDARAFINSCATYDQLTDEGYYAKYNNDMQVLMYNTSLCRAIEMLRDAKPSEESYVNKIIFDMDFLNYLPAIVNPSPSCDYLCRQYAANERRIPWYDFEVAHFLSVDVENDYRMKVTTDTEILTLEGLARADFNGDGLEDLLLRVTTGPIGGTWGTTRLYLLSRETPHSVLWALAADKHLCRRYQCENYYTYPPALRGND